jgi:hypothetical protein
MNRLMPLALASLFAVAAPLHAQAQSTAALPDWDHLSPAQRELLIAPIRDRWNASPDARERMLGHAGRWKSMTPQQRAQARRGVERWQGMSPAERAQAQDAFKRFRQMSPADRKAMREKLRAMTPEQRREWFKSQAAPARR